MARINRTRRGRGGSRRIMKKRQMAGPVEDHIEKIKKVAAEIIGEHKEIIVFLPDDESLENLPADFSYDEENIRNFIRNHVYAGNIRTVLYMNSNTKLSLKSLNGTDLIVEMKKKNKFVNGMQITSPGFTQEKDGSKAEIYIIHGVIMSGFKVPTAHKERRVRSNPERKEFVKNIRGALKKSNGNMREAYIMAKKSAKNAVQKKK